MEFKQLGAINEVGIPPRKDSRGRRYDFVRFLEVKDERLLVTRMDNLFLEGRKLHVNIPRFKRSEHVMVKEKETMNRRIGRAYVGDIQEGSYQVTNKGMSFAHVTRKSFKGYKEKQEEIKV